MYPYSPLYSAFASQFNEKKQKEKGGEIKKYGKVFVFFQCANFSISLPICCVFFSHVFSLMIMQKADDALK